MSSCCKPRGNLQRYLDCIVPEPINASSCSMYLKGIFRIPPAIDNPKLGPAIGPYCYRHTTSLERRSMHGLHLNLRVRNTTAGEREGLAAGTDLPLAQARTGGRPASHTGTCGGRAEHCCTATPAAPRPATRMQHRCWWGLPIPPAGIGVAPPPTGSAETLGHPRPARQPGRSQLAIDHHC